MRSSAEQARLSTLLARRAQPLLSQFAHAHRQTFWFAAHGDWADRHCPVSVRDLLQYFIALSSPIVGVRYPYLINRRPGSRPSATRKLGQNETTHTLPPRSWHTLPLLVSRRSHCSTQLVNRHELTYTAYAVVACRKVGCSPRVHAVGNNDDRAGRDNQRSGIGEIVREVASGSSKGGL